MVVDTVDSEGGDNTTLLRNITYDYVLVYFADSCEIFQLPQQTIKLTASQNLFHYL
jgi:hypothetical protein